jgi:glycosyltransferase involved in cell wall biosynthesis
MLLENSSYPEDVRVRAEARTLARAGLEVTVVAPRRRGHPGREVVDGVRVYRYPAPSTGAGVLGYLWEYVYATLASVAVTLVVLWRRGFDVIHLHNPPDTLVLAALPAKLLGKRCIFDHHDLAPELYNARFGRTGGGLVYWALRLFERLNFLAADHVIATNECYRRVAIERGKVPAARVTVVRNGPDLERFRPVEPEPGLRARAGTIIGYVGVMGFQDGLDHLLRAVRHLVVTLDRRDVHCVLIGDGDAWEGLRRLARRLEIDEYMWFTGRISSVGAAGRELVRYLSTADICVDPQPSNPYSDRSTTLKLMEYMALAKPIVAFDLPEHRVTAGDAAVYVGGNDDQAFARAIAELMDDPERRRRMGERGRRRVEAELSWEHSVPRLLDAYRAVLGAGPG